jgi:hypothetical protein
MLLYEKHYKIIVGSATDRRDSLLYCIVDGFPGPHNKGILWSWGYKGISMWHGSCRFNCKAARRGGNMKLASRQKTGSTTGFRQPGFMKQSLRQCVYLLGKSLDRYGYFKKLGAPDILVAAEKVLIRRQLLFLFNLRAELTR